MKGLCLLVSNLHQQTSTHTGDFSMRTFKRTLALTFAAAFLLTAVQDADARRRTRRLAKAFSFLKRGVKRQQQQPNANQTFAGFAQKHGMKSAVHNGKLFIKVDKTKLSRNFDEYARIGNGKVLEFNGTGHLHTRYNGKKDANFLSGLSIGTYRPPSYGKRVTVVVKLTDSEHRELDSYIGSASASRNGAKQEIGSFNYNGGRPKRYYPSSTKANCTSWISSAKLDGRQSLGRTCGVWDAASPRGWIRSLAQRGNKRVEAVLLHGFEGDVSNARAVNQFVSQATTK
jgi:hypothetical protein